MTPVKSVDLIGSLTRHREWAAYWLRLTLSAVTPADRAKARKQRSIHLAKVRALERSIATRKR